jgi:hypothetical protein
MTETKRRIAIWLLAFSILAVTVFAFAAANSSTTPDAHAVVADAKAKEAKAGGA